MKLHIRKPFIMPKYKFNLIVIPILIFILTIGIAMYFYGIKASTILLIFSLFSFYFGIIIFVNLSYNQGLSFIDRKINYMYKICLPTAVLLITLFMIMEAQFYIQVLCSIIASSLGIAGGYIIAKEQIKYYQSNNKISNVIQKEYTVNPEKTEQL